MFRGGSWSLSGEAMLSSPGRYRNDPDFPNQQIIGYRCVLESGGGRKGAAPPRRVFTQASLRRGFQEAKLQAMGLKSLEIAIPGDPLARMLDRDSGVLGVGHAFSRGAGFLAQLARQFPVSLPGGSPHAVIDGG